MEPPEQRGTQSAIHIPQGEGKSIWILGDLLTFKVHEQSESVAIFEYEVPPEGGAGPHLHRTQDETTTSSKATSSSSSASARSMPL